MFYFFYYSQVKECLKLDPDHKECFPFYKKVKKLVKQLQAAQDSSNSENWDDCVNKARKILETESKVYNFLHTAKSHICHCQAKVGRFFLLFQERTLVKGLGKFVKTL